MPIGGVGEFQTKDLGVFLGLLQTRPGSFVFGLGFDHGDGEIAGMTKKIISPLLGAAVNFRSGNHYPPVSESPLLREGMRLVIPSRLDQLGKDIFTAGIGFVTHLLPHGFQSHKVPWAGAS